MAYKDFKDKYLVDPSVHNWVKDMIRIADEKDVVDVLKGLRFLQKLFGWKFEEMVNPGKRRNLDNETLSSLEKRL